ncbi:MAG: hypothetical protein ACRCVW_02700 [Brevinema sp.]
MKLLLILVLSIIPIFMFADFKKAQILYQEKHFAPAINESVSAIHLSITNIINKTASALPYLNKATETNISYGINLYNNNSFFSFNMSYNFKDMNINQSTIHLSLDYSFESVKYYQTYIYESQFYIPPSAPYELLELSNNLILWYPKEALGHYVYLFSNHNQKKSLEISGILLSLTFPKNISNQDRDRIFQNIINKISWKELQDIFQD